MCIRDSQEETLRCIRLARLKFPQKMFMVVARFVQRTENRYIKQTVVVEMEKIFTQGYAVQHKSYIVALTGEISRQQHQRLQQMAASNKASVGISWEFTDLADLRAAYLQAVSCIKQAGRFGRVAEVFDYDHFFYWDLLYNYTGKIPLEKFINPGLLLLQCYDTKTGNCLFETLRTYLEYYCNVQVATEVLFIHRNTLLYRLRRIEELTGFDLNDYMTRGCLLHSIHLIVFLSQK